jgi:RNA polymerase sigma-70 factor, ECF subfamily
VISCRVQVIAEPTREWSSHLSHGRGGPGRWGCRRTGNRARLSLRQGRCDSGRTVLGVSGDVSELDDAALLRAVAHGDEEALGCLYDRHAGWLTVRLARRCSSAELVDQAVQDTFLALWRGAHGYRGGGDVAAWIWGVGIRRLIDAIRRDRGRRPWSWRRRGEPAVVISAEDQVLVAIEHGRLGPALASLSPELRTAIEATALDGLSTAEAAVLLGVPEGTVKSRCHRARQALRALLAEAQEGNEATSARRHAWGAP